MPVADWRGQPFRTHSRGTKFGQWRPLEVFGQWRRDEIVAIGEHTGDQITVGRDSTEGNPGEILIGTCSWTDPTLVKSDVFYPDEKMTAEERLAFYAARFSIVEVDATYYAPPAEKTSGLWVERTPDHFVFDIKAFRLLTQHPTPPASLWKDFREELPTEIAEKRNIYMRDLPRELQAEAVKLFRRVSCRFIRPASSVWSFSRCRRSSIRPGAASAI